jgi:hypothetical protein
MPEPLDEWPDRVRELVAIACRRQLRAEDAERAVAALLRPIMKEYDR